MISFISGVLVAGYAVAGLFFLRFWRLSRDRLFLMFALAFWLLAVQRAALAAWEQGSPASGWLYLVRLLAFVIILVAIVDKNRPASGASGAR